MDSGVGGFFVRSFRCRVKQLQYELRDRGRGYKVGAHEDWLGWLDLLCFLNLRDR